MDDPSTQIYIVIVIKMPCMNTLICYCYIVTGWLTINCYLHFWVNSVLWETEKLCYNSDSNCLSPSQLKNVFLATSVWCWSFRTIFVQFDTRWPFTWICRRKCANLSLRCVHASSLQLTPVWCLKPPVLTHLDFTFLLT